MGDRVTDPGDEAILALAHSNCRILFTLDKDFGELAIVRGLPHSGIVRLANFRARQQGPIAIQILESHGAELLAGAIITAEPGRLRIRQPPPPNEAES
jgi:predicted nuclease of predicted toxin-antitoxin system